MHSNVQEAFLLLQLWVQAPQKGEWVEGRNIAWPSGSRWLAMKSEADFSVVHGMHALRGSWFSSVAQMSSFIFIVS